MQELEKILEEVKRVENEYINEEYGMMFKLGAACIVSEIKDIIRKHMNDNPCGGCSRRKWYQEGYRDGKNDNNGWIPIDEGNIPDHEVLACNRYAEELIGYIGKDESGFYCESDGEVVGYVTAWMEKPEPYKPECGDK